MDSRRAAAWHRRQSALARTTAARLAALWRQVDAGNPTGSWARLTPAALGVVTAGQRTAAAGAGGYVTGSVRDQNATPDPAGMVSVGQLVGVASDGRDLASLLAVPGWQTEQARAAGMSSSDALAAGGYSLARIGGTQVLDAGRVAVGLHIAADRVIHGYVRMLAGRGCSRCAVLAGTWYRYNRGFQRHPNCQCVHVPATKVVRGGWFSPRDYFDSLSAAEQDRVFTAAGAQAIRDGADISQVVNARRGMSTASYGSRRVQITSTGTGRSGLARMRLGSGRVRLMPEAIYQLAGDDRQLLIRLLYQHGYIL